ncbi:uncharacterized protein [Amphiura filiformis]|uniref:uncharacterized protein isoform X2 n=1 Tax=Amphiura filiformis TaxID=82378 RepID=UPI003B21C693
MLSTSCSSMVEILTDLIRESIIEENEKLFTRSKMKTLLTIEVAGGDSPSKNMTSKPRGTYLDPLKACALSGVSTFQAGKSESSTYTKYMGIVRQTRRNASRTSVLNDVERTRFTSVIKRIDSEQAYSTSVLERQRRMFKKSLVDIEKHKRDLLKQKDTGLYAIGKEDPFDKQRHSMDGSISIPELIKRQKGRSRKRNGMTIRSKGGSKKRLHNTRLPSLTNESIQESEDEDAVNGVKASSEVTDVKLSKRTSGLLTLPVFIKSGVPSDKTQTNATFYTGNDVASSTQKKSEESSLKPAEKFKLPAINSNMSKESSEWT